MNRLVHVLFSYPTWYTECRDLLDADSEERRALFEYFDQFNIGTIRAARHQHILGEPRKLTHNFDSRTDQNKRLVGDLRRRLKERYADGSPVRRMLAQLSDEELIAVFLQHEENSGRKREGA